MVLSRYANGSLVGREYSNLDDGPCAQCSGSTLWRDRTLVFLSSQMLQRRYGPVRVPRAASGLKVAI